MNSELTYNDDGKGFYVDNADLTHHTKYYGSAGDKVAPSPVVVVQRGLEPVTYLDSFGANSSYREEIDAFVLREKEAFRRPRL